MTQAPLESAVAMETEDQVGHAPPALFRSPGIDGESGAVDLLSVAVAVLCRTVKIDLFATVGHTRSN